MFKLTLNITFYLFIVNTMANICIAEYPQSSIQISDTELDDICDSLTSLKITKEEKRVYVRAQLHYKEIFNKLKEELKWTNIIFPKPDEFPWELLSVQLPGTGDHFIQILSEKLGQSFMVMPHFNINDCPSLIFNNIGDTAEFLKKLASLAEQGRLNRPSEYYADTLRSDGWLV